MFQFVRMADQTAADAEALVLQAQSSGYLSKMMQRQGLGAILPAGACRKTLTPPPPSNDQPCLTTNPFALQLLGRTAKNVLWIAFLCGQTAFFPGPLFRDFGGR